MNTEQSRCEIKEIKIATATLLGGGGFTNKLAAYLQKYAKVDFSQYRNALAHLFVALYGVGLASTMPYSFSVWTKQVEDIALIGQSDGV